jgi:hypothetical protein
MMSSAIPSAAMDPYDNEELRGQKEHCCCGPLLMEKTLQPCCVLKMIGIPRYARDFRKAQ